jgi:general secretion pathway protein B
MSVILDALKKLDREKSFRRNGTANIAVEILRPDLPHSGKRIPLYFVIITLTAVAAAAITYAVVDLGFLSKSSPPAPMNPPAPSQQVAPAPLSHEPVHDARDEINRVPPKIQDPVEGKKPAESQNLATPLGQKEASQNVILEKATVAPEITKKPTEQTPDGSATAPPSLKLSAIVWYEEPSKRFAMINGVIITEGSVIEGVKVEEIYPNRVRFSHNGRPFEISIK